MWSFSNKNKERDPVMSIAQALEQLAAIGIRTRPNITSDDLLFSLDGAMDSPVDWTGLLCTLGSEVERGEFQRISDDIWHIDAECIEDTGDYVRVLERFIILTKGLIPLTSLCDHVDIENGEAWVEFILDGKPVHWDLEVDNDWLDPNLYTKMQNLAIARGGGKKFFITALGQDSLISFGNPAMKDTLSDISGLKFEWE
jgi:hypothetical protein